MAPVKRSAEDPASQPKKSKQLKLDTMITVSPLTKKEEKKGSVVTNLSDSQEIITFSSGSTQNSQTEAQKPSVTRSVSSVSAAPEWRHYPCLFAAPSRLVPQIG